MVLFFEKNKLGWMRGEEEGETKNTLQSEENKFLDATLFSVKSLDILKLSDLLAHTQLASC